MQRKPQGLTLQQVLVLKILEKGPKIASTICDEYESQTSGKLSRNYQYIITRRLYEQKYVTRTKAKISGRADAFKFGLTPKGKKALSEAKKICRLITK